MYALRGGPKCECYALINIVNYTSKQNKNVQKDQIWKTSSYHYMIFVMGWLEPKNSHPLNVMFMQILYLPGTLPVWLEP